MASREEILADFQVRNDLKKSLKFHNLPNLDLPPQACTGIDDLDIAICHLEESNWVLVVSTHTKIYLRRQIATLMTVV